GAALAGILAAYLVFDAPAVTTAPLLLALLTVATMNGPRRTAFAALASAGVAIATPIVHGGSDGLVSGLTAVRGLAAAVLGTYLRGRIDTALSASVLSETTLLTGERFRNRSAVFLPRAGDVAGRRRPGAVPETDRTTAATAQAAGSCSSHDRR